MARITFSIGGIRGRFGFFKGIFRVSMTHPSLCVQPRVQWGDLGHCWGFTLAATQSLALPHFPVSLQVWEKGDKTNPQKWEMAPRAVGIPCVPMEMRWEQTTRHRSVFPAWNQFLSTPGWDLIFNSLPQNNLRSPWLYSHTPSPEQGEGSGELGVNWGSGTCTKPVSMKINKIDQRALGVLM